jgi:hypothetical protein
MHFCCRLSWQYIVLADLKSRHRNPLVPNCRNERCTDLTTDVALKKELQSYMCWQPHMLAMDWFGPCFRPRAFALLLVCHRLKAEHSKRLAQLNKDVRNLLVKYLAKIEYLYVPYRTEP